MKMTTPQARGLRRPGLAHVTRRSRGLTADPTVPNTNSTLPGHNATRHWGPLNLRTVCPSAGIALGARSGEPDDWSRADPSNTLASKRPERIRADWP
jgi:hypothetical protein